MWNNSENNLGQCYSLTATVSLTCLVGNHTQSQEEYQRMSF